MTDYMSNIPKGVRVSDLTVVKLTKTPERNDVRQIYEYDGITGDFKSVVTMKVSEYCSHYGVDTAYFYRANHASTRFIGNHYVSFKMYDNILGAK